MALTITPQADFGDDCPDFNLPGVDGKNYSKKDLTNGKPAVVMFICNHCPYVQAIEDRLITLGQDLKALGVVVLAIGSNDERAYAEDSFENMAKRAREKSYSFAYAQDASQEVARKFGAVCTPDFFVYDQNLKLAYRGRLDDSWKDPAKVTRRELLNAVQALLQGQTTPLAQTPSMGCSIKWK
jgi:peroxiredoxin